MTIYIKPNQIHEVCKEIKLFNVKHMPFEKTLAGYKIEIISPESAHSFFLLKYRQQKAPCGAFLFIATTTILLERKVAYSNFF